MKKRENIKQKIEKLETEIEENNYKIKILRIENRQKGYEIKRLIRDFNEDSLKKIQAVITVAVAENLSDKEILKRVAKANIKDYSPKTKPRETTIIFQHDKRSGLTYAYEAEYWWDEKLKQSRSKRKIIGKVDTNVYLAGGLIGLSENEIRERIIPTKSKKK